MLIVHRCLDCGHPDVWGERDKHPVLGIAGSLPTNCGQYGCCRKCQWNPTPEAIPRYDHNGHRLLHPVLPPGSAARWHTAETTHDCQACRDLHTQITGGQPATA